MSLASRHSHFLASWKKTHAFWHERFQIHDTRHCRWRWRWRCVCARSVVVGCLYHNNSSLQSNDNYNYIWCLVYWMWQPHLYILLCFELEGAEWRREAVFANSILVFIQYLGKQPNVVGVTRFLMLFGLSLRAYLYRLTGGVGAGRSMIHLASTGRVGTSCRRVKTGAIWYVKMASGDDDDNHDDGCLWWL